MRVFIKKKFKQFNRGSDVIVTFEKGNELIKKGIAQLDPVSEDEKESEEKQVEKKKTVKKTTKKQ